MFRPATTWTAPTIASLPSWSDAKRVAVDVETRDDDLTALGCGVRRGGKMVGISFAIEDGPSHYLPFGHEDGGNLDRGNVLAYMRDQARDFRGEIAGNGLPYDLEYLWSADIEFAGATSHRDVQIAEPLLDELQHEYNLDAILKRRGLPGKDEDELRRHAEAWGLNAKRDLWRLHSGAVGAYAERDVVGPLELLRRQERELAAQSLLGPFAMESEAMLELLRMTRRGVRVSRERLAGVRVHCERVIADEAGRIEHLTGVRISVDKRTGVHRVMTARELEPALAHRGIAVPRTNPHKITKKTQPSVTKELLLAHKRDEVVQAILHARAAHKVLTTYVVGVEEHLIGDRLHPAYKQMHAASENDDDADDEGARFGRTASRHPNVQASPARHPEFGKMWRAIYIPEEGEDWACFDYSQQEPRTTVHYAELSNLFGAKAFADLYRNDPRTDSHDMFAKMSGLPRKDAKEVFLGLCYGMGGGLLATKLGLPTVERRDRRGELKLYAGPEAQAVLDQFDERVPFVRALSYLCQEKAKARGYLLLIDKRRCRFPTDDFGNFDWTYKALNRLIQGSAAIQTKTALVLLGRAGFKPRLTVHDEFDFSLSRGNLRGTCASIAKIMLEALPLNVPSRVDVETGADYAHLTELELAA